MSVDEKFLDRCQFRGEAPAGCICPTRTLWFIQLAKTSISFSPFTFIGLPQEARASTRIENKQNSCTIKLTSRQFYRLYHQMSLFLHSPRLEAQTLQDIYMQPTITHRFVFICSIEVTLSAVWLGIDSLTDEEIARKNAPGVPVNVGTRKMYELDFTRCSDDLYVILYILTILINGATVNTYSKSRLWCRWYCGF